ncbi:RTX toxin acyltransferase family protein [Andreprevotia lacus DSM 23236]|jgi:cytolysin-activating lysine-acyltransferase|uniref:RTX toxin-activating lysine-acyltransferase n=1 Tax=Andreprevotia lacus DSM 23236 TaxID=1121001 RepID=A0A1W1XZ43_9NEIS|nr:toxin-activating lysine-acyltransferase [Andreprevotia lacus]SMC29186.1 RTX toxin acyltransferase family protein [Andreprevotia lacus DSM 23236]
MNIQLEPNPAQKEIGARIGYATHLMATHPAYCGFQFASVPIWIRIPIIHRQIEFFFDADGIPQGFATWALVNPHTEAKMLEDPDYILHPSEWKEGDIVWIMDFCVKRPYMQACARMLRDHTLKHVAEVKFARRDPQGNLLRKGVLRRKGLPVDVA